MAVTAPERLTVSALARLVGDSPDTVRYYEKVGLLPAPPRSTSGYRLFDATAVDRMYFIRGAQRLGLRLRDIKTLLSVRDDGVCPCEPADELLRTRLSEVDAELRRLTALRTELSSMVQRMADGDDCPDPLPGTWRPPAGAASHREEVDPCDCCD